MIKRLPISILFILLLFSFGAADNIYGDEFGLPVKIKKGVKYYKFDRRWRTKKGLGKYISKIKKDIADDKEHRNWENAYIIETRHYIIKTNHSKRLLDYTARLMEDMYVKYNEMFRGKIRMPGKFVIKIFKIVTFVGRNEDFLFGALLHEGTHQFLFATIGCSQPTWLEEGCATYFETGYYNKKGELYFGDINRERLGSLKKALQGGSASSLDSFVSYRGVFSKRQYAEAWGLIYFFAKSKNKRYKDDLRQYMRDLKSKKFDFKKLFMKHFLKRKERFSSFKRRWKRFIMKLDSRKSRRPYHRWHLSYPKIPRIPDGWFSRKRRRSN
jgi:hypothetical protein